MPKAPWALSAETELGKLLEGFRVRSILVGLHLVKEVLRVTLLFAYVPTKSRHPPSSARPAPQAEQWMP